MADSVKRLATKDDDESGGPPFKVSKVNLIHNSDSNNSENMRYDDEEFDNSINSEQVNEEMYDDNSHYSFEKDDSADNLSKRYEEQQKYSMLQPDLREFDILDEARETDDYSTSDSSDSLSYSEPEDVPEDIVDVPEDIVDVPQDIVEMMLEESLPQELRGQRQIKTKSAAKNFVRMLKEGLIKNNLELPKSFDSKVEDGNNSANEQTNDTLQSLETGLNATSQENTEDGEVEYQTKIVLEELDVNHFDLLPENWIKVSHKSGMPIYLHRKSRVCTTTRPYYLGPGSARNHSIPLSAIPCLQYKRALEKEKEMAEQAKENPLVSDDNIRFHAARIETAAENQAAQSLEPQSVLEYCKSLFIFKTINSIKHKTWVARRKQMKEKKQEKQRQRLMLPDGTKLLKFPIIKPGNDSNSRPHREWIMNPTGKSYVCILHEYVQHALKKQPSYEFKELENPSTPYSATVSINGTRYGTAMGASKKQAKLEAAKVALEILIPEMKNKIVNDNSTESNTSGISIFDEIKIEDPRVAEFCAKTTEPSPYAILLTCLQRNYALADVKVNYAVNKLEHKKNVFTMKVGSHTVTITCKNKRDGKQRASQAILQALHPHITTWGSLLRLYGNRSVKNVKAKKQEEQEITLLQSKASLNQPNTAILDKLRTEMRKLRDRNLSIKPIGKFVPPDDVVLPSLSSTDLNKISL